VGRFRREDLLRYFRSAYRPGTMVIAAAGRLQHGEVRRLVEERFGGLAPGGRTRHGSAPHAVRRLVRRSKRELEQVHLCVGVPAPSQVHPDRYGVYVLSTILGGSLSSRLFQEVREKRGLAYSISSGVSAYADAGIFNIYAGTGLGQVDEVLRLVREALVRMREEPVPADELRRSKDHLKGGLVLALESTGSRMSQLARQEIAFGRLLPLDEVLDGIEAVSVDDILRLAGELFRGDLHASLLGNLGRYRPRPALLRL
jgi:predicted Zn-dependent peptidase